MVKVKFIVVPTLLPSLLPAPRPSPAPTPLPTPEPTPEPTQRIQTRVGADRIEVQELYVANIRMGGLVIDGRRMLSLADEGSFEGVDSGRLAALEAQLYVERAAREALEAREERLEAALGRQAAELRSLRAHVGLPVAATEDFAPGFEGISERAISEQ